MNISIIYIYPDIIEINNEINLFRIVDRNIKETLVFYAKNTNDSYQLYLTNTMTGDNRNFHNTDNLENINIWINKIKANEDNIIGNKNFEKIEKYILNLIEY
ncbi:hypothetical protein CHL78_017860 [Romboutsia weinsteinii]|uniref:Uncharacterized protein n=1 Tax=Romboutsia weinsteinii TaxID=2020949 RepID=A0A371IYG5_9FIRM|nr:hypothetical protein [Romboutsia weinsteinii]RDY25506.1 hypothetical protein CHL78_017860 [Romboutsia weinsteinii]